MNYEIENTPAHNGRCFSMPSIPSNISSGPSNHVIHFDTQVSLFKPSKRFFCHHDLTSPSMEDSEEEELEQVESEEEQAESEQAEEEKLEDENSEEEDDENSEEEDDESEENVNSNIMSDSENSESNLSSIPSDRVIHFNTQLSLFRCSERFFTKHDLTSLSIEQQKEEAVDDDDDDEEEEEEEEELEESESEEKHSEEEESEDEDSEEEDESDECINGHFISELENSESNLLSFPSDHVIHFNTQLSPFRCSQRFFTKHDLTSLSIEESDVGGRGR